tara:strand:- start:139744 stop:140451 length:708 start_codon:yes stop_codon:yes gene_type:complete
MTFKNWIVSTGLTESSSRKYESAVFGSISDWAIDSGIISENLIHFDNPEALQAISDQIKALPLFKERNSVGNQMYSAGLNKYLEYLNVSQNETEEDIKKIKSDSSASETEKEALVKSRSGQGAFRKNLLDFWDGCAATGYRAPKLLVASHIKPWRSSDNEERLDPFNGLLLIPNLDKAFDKGFISFKSSGEIILSELLQEPQKLGINNQMKIKVTEAHLLYMEYHRDVVLINVKG